MPWLVLWLACSSVLEPTEPASEQTHAPEPVAPERRALHEAELELLRAEALKRLDSGAVSEALTPIVAAERLSSLPEANRRALEAVSEDEALAARFHAAMADAVRSDPGRAREHYEAARRLQARGEIRDRYAEGAAAPLARVAGVDRTLIHPVLALASSQHVDPPEPRRLAEGGARRLVHFAEDPTARAAFPAIGALSESAAALAESPPSELADVVASAIGMVDRAVADGIPEEIVVSEFVEGALAEFDAYTRVAWPAELQDFEAHHSGIEVGVGVELEVRDQALWVALPIPGAPAWTAGVHQGDQVLAVVDERGTFRVEEVGEALGTALRGAPETPVELQVARDGAPRSFAMNRAPVAMQTVHGWTRKADNAPDVAIPGHDGLAYLRISAFRSYTDESVAELLDGVDPQGVVLDLRGNPGGDVQAAANLVDLFVGEGIVASLEGPGAPPPPSEGEVAWNVLVAGSPLEDVPVVVLIDRETASAAEIAAGGLAQRDGVVLVGERTYGKGWSQGLSASEDHGFALQVTNSAWKLPDGRMLHRTPGDADWGVVPDIQLVESAAERWQNQARRTRLEFPKTHADGSPMTPPEPGRREGLPVLDRDYAIERAVGLLREGAPAR